MTQSPSGVDRPTAADVDRDAVVTAALALAAEKGWESVSLRDIAARAGLGLAQFYAAFPGKPAILRAFADQVDATVLEAHEADTDAGGDTAGAPPPEGGNGIGDDTAEPARDRLFDVLMTRFDQLQPHRAALKTILPAYRRDPALALGGLCQLRGSMRRMLEAAALDSRGLRGELRLDTLCAVYLATLRVWLDDESTDMARTMATLDGYLRRLERPAAMLAGLRAPRARRPGPGWESPASEPGEAAGGARI